MTIQDQYTSTLANTQETWAAAVESLTDNVKKMFADAGSPLAPVDPNTAIDNVFDFWEKALVAQREAAHKFVAASVEAGAKVRTQAESVSAVLKDQAETVGASIKEHVESVQKAVTEQTAKK
jgi:hypothetical protein